MQTYIFTPVIGQHFIITSTFFKYFIKIFCHLCMTFVGEVKSLFSKGFLTYLFMYLFIYFVIAIKILV